MEVKATWNYLGFKALDHSQIAGFLTRIEYLKWYSEGRVRRPQTAIEVFYAGIREMLAVRPRRPEKQGSGVQSDTSRAAVMTT
jgi:hypothetical protein